MAGPTTEAEGRRRRPESGPPAAEELGPRRRLRLPGRRTAAGLLVAVTLVTGFGIWALYGSSWLRIEQVAVGGVRALTAQQVRAAAAVPVGAPMASLDKEAVQRRLQRRLPRIRSATVVRSWPHGVHLKVTERRPELLLDQDGTRREVDAAGVPFPPRKTGARHLPLLVLEPGPTAQTRYFGTTRLRRAAAEVAAALPDAVSRRTRTVRVRSYDSITLELTGGRTVMWGSSERNTAKAESLTAVMKAEKDARHFDVRVPSAPAVERS